MEYIWHPGEAEPAVVDIKVHRRIRTICSAVHVNLVTYEWHSYYWETVIEGDSFKFQLHPMSDCWLLICGNVAWSWGGRKDNALTGFLKRIKALSE